jgi:quinol monooxygenase YgiN
MAKTKTKRRGAKKPRAAAKKSARRKNKAVALGLGKLPKDALTLVVHMKSRPGQEMLLEAELRALVGPTRKEEGCLLYDLHRWADGEGAFLFHEVWASREAHAAHLRTDHFLRWSARKDALTASRESSFWKKVV